MRYFVCEMLGPGKQFLRMFICFLLFLFPFMQNEIVDHCCGHVKNVVQNCHPL